MFSSLVSFSSRRSSFLIGVGRLIIWIWQGFLDASETVGIILLLHVLCKCIVNLALLTLAIFPFPCIYINKENEKEMGFV